MAFSFLIVDDESPSRDYIRDLIHEFAPGSVVYEARSVASALPLIRHNKPDILFLDISMPREDGFDLLKQLPERDFELVFITAYVEFALKAIKESACDYLLKPVKKADFKTAVNKAVTMRKIELERRNLLSQKESEAAGGSLMIYSHLGAVKVVLKDIVFVEADNTYSTLYTMAGEKIVISKPLSYFEKTLGQTCFFRVHKSYIVNLNYFKEYFPKKSRLLLRNVGRELPVSRYRQRDFFYALKQASYQG